MGGYGSLFLKKGSVNFTFNIKEWKNNISVIFGMLLYLSSSVFYLSALKYGELSVVYPLTSLGYVYISFLSINYLDEKMNMKKWAGITLIIIGSFLVVR
jgi:uncharacterized membrane protein